MQFSDELIPGTLVKRYKRFLADVQLENGDIVTAHCPNTGAMTGCATPGWQVYLSPSNNPKRKLAYTWELARNDQGDWIGINTHNANKLVTEALIQNRLPPFSGYTEIRQEVKYGRENSRIDIFLQYEDRPDCYIEVKSVTLLKQDGQGYFPDAQTQRGQKHLRELTQLAEEGKQAVLLFCVQHSGIKQVQIASEIDPEYYRLLVRAIDKGVKVHAFTCTFSQKKVELNQEILFNL